MVGIVIVNYRTNLQTIDFVKKELIKINIPKRIVIVNNEAGPDDSELFSNALGAKVVPIELDLSCIEGEIFLINSIRNLGFAIGNNLGARYLLKFTDIKYLLFTNNDIILKSNDVVEKLIKKIVCFPDVSIIGPKVVDMSGRPVSPRFDKVSPWRFIFHYFFYPLYSSKILSKIGIKTKGFEELKMREIQEGLCYWVAGAFMLMKIEDFKKVDGFDPNTFLYCEEKILSEKLIKINKKVYYYSEPVIVSIGGLTTSKFLSDRNRDEQIFKSELYYYKKYWNISVFTYYLLLITRYIYFNIYYRK